MKPAAMQNLKMIFTTNERKFDIIRLSLLYHVIAVYQVLSSLDVFAHRAIFLTGTVSKDLLSFSITQSFSF